MKWYPTANTSPKESLTLPFLGISMELVLPQHWGKNSATVGQTVLSSRKINCRGLAGVGIFVWFCPALFCMKKLLICSVIQGWKIWFCKKSKGHLFFQCCFMVCVQRLHLWFWLFWTCFGCLPVSQQLNSETLQLEALLGRSLGQIRLV